MRQIDHLVLPVTTLTLARSRLVSLGFTVAPDARHPFGTGNCCVFFRNRSYLEPITIIDRNAADMAAAEGLFFVRRLKRFMERQGEGFAMAALTTADAESDAARFRAADMPGGPVFRFTRMAAGPDGSESEMGVALAYAEHPAAPDATLFACQHFAADVLFRPEFLEHPNGAIGVAAAIAVAEKPREFDALFALVSARDEAVSTPVGPAQHGDASRLLALDPGAFRERFGVEPPDPRRGLLFAAFEVHVSDLDRAIGYAGPTAKRQGGGIVVPPGPGLGATLVFREPENG